jgi:hypothetical protein
MTKQLSIAAALVLAVACKTEAPSPANAAPSPAAATGEGTALKARSAKIDVKPVPPALPTDPAAAASEDKPRDDPARREAWRKRREARLDADGDGVISDEERTAAMRERITNMRTRLDADGDGKLTPAELANAPGRMHFDEPATIDTNHDGDISADEFAAAVKARRDQRRAARGSAAGDAP